VIPGGNDPPGPHEPPQRILRFAIAALVVGAVTAAFAIVFRVLLQMVFVRGYGAANVLAAFAALPWAERLLIPALGGAAAASLGAWFARRQRVGMAAILDAVSLGGHRLSLPVSLGKAGASFVAIASGGSIGREGPLLQVGAAAGARLAGVLRLSEAQQRRLVAAGTAAGFAAAYNTPLAAVLFVLEVVTRRASVDVVVPTAWATVVATWLTRLAVGPGPLYGLRTFTWAHPAELVVYAGLGLAAGLLGVAFMSLLDRGKAFAQRLRDASSWGRRWSRTTSAALGAAGGVMVGAMTLLWPQVAGNGYEAIQQMLDGPVSAVTLVLLLGAKAFATTASVSSGSPGGVFTPSLFLGATLGGAIAACVDLVGGGHGLPGGYVLVGMASMIAATTHAPITAAVLAFELSGDYGIVLPLLLATGGATVVARALRTRSIYQ